MVTTILSSMTDVESDETRMLRLEVERSIEFKARVTRLLDVSAIPISRECEVAMKMGKAQSPP